MNFLWALYVYFISPILTLLFFIVFIWVIAGWLVGFGIIDRRNPNARAILGLLSAVCEPMCRPIRRIIPPINGVLDLSALIVLLIIVFVRDWAIPELIMLLSGSPRIR
ncbi:MAG TPA: YggT family protein [Hyphomonadaceae bacterium]|nr:YggT family protein [Hyphomonadaceae bacterium]